MDFVINYNNNLDSGFLSDLFFRQEESNKTNDTISLRRWEHDRHTVKILRSYPQDLRRKTALKGFWDENYQPYVCVVKTCQDYDTSEECYYFEEHGSTMKSLLNLEDNWDSYGAESPNVNSFDEAKKTLDYLEAVGFPPTKLVPSVEGGISFLFVRGNKYADIECDNDGDIICGLSDRTHEPVIWEVGVDKTLFATVEKIREFFRN